MNSFVKKGLYCALFVGGLSLLGMGAANAAETSGDDGLASGTQLAAVLDAPVTLGGNTVSVIGDSSSDPATATPATSTDTSPSATTSGADAIASGTQVPVDATVPVTVDGNAISVVGDSSTSGASPDAPAESPATGGTENPVTSGESSDTPSLLGYPLLGDPLLGDPLLGDSQLSDSQLSDSQLSGTQVPVQTTTPVSATGNAVSVFGDSSSGGATSIAPASDGSGAATTDGGDSALGGTQVALSGTAPVQATGNTLSLMSASVPVDGSATPGESVSSGTSTTGGDSSVPVAPVIGRLVPRTAMVLAAVGANTAGADIVGSNTAGADTAGTSTASGAAPSTPVGTPSPVVNVPRTTLAGASVMSTGARAVVSERVPMVAAASLAALAGTGVEAAPFLALIALFPLVGFGILLVARRRLERPTRH